MKLKQLCKDIHDLTIRPFKDVSISGITSNSKLVVPNGLFIAKRGLKSDGSHFIPEAIQNGAVAIVSDVFDPTLSQVVQIITPHVNEIEAKLAARYYGNPSEHLWMVGVTGTCGKTTTTYAIKHVLEASNVSCGMIGTIEYMVGKKSYSATHTTPDVCANHKLLKEMQTQGCTACVMEVTSHALHQGRVSEVEFDVAVFTNLTHEHLDYHKTMDDYFQAKSGLFRNLKPKKESPKAKLPKIALINADDPRKEKFIAVTNPEARVVTYGIDHKADIQAKNIEFGMRGTEFVVSYKENEERFFWPLVGRFNVYNALACIGVALMKGLSLSHISERLSTFQTAPGRLEMVANGLGIHIFVDYAHKPEALKNVLQTLKEFAKQKIIVLFGCGGDRDREKRPIMGQIATDGADIVVLTSDNPRSEDPQKIIQEILKGCTQSENCIVIPDRKEAIHKAISIAAPGDIVLIAGKGHETKQLFAHLFVDFDDRKVARECAENVYHKRTLQMVGDS